MTTPTPKRVFVVIPRQHRAHQRPPNHPPGPRSTAATTRSFPGHSPAVS